MVHCSEAGAVPVAAKERLNVTGCPGLPDPDDRLSTVWPNPNPPNAVKRIQARTGASALPNFGFARLKKEHTAIRNPSLAGAAQAHQAQNV